MGNLKLEPALWWAVDKKVILKADTGIRADSKADVMLIVSLHLLCPEAGLAPELK